jgi:hypothetical protein
VIAQFIAATATVLAIVVGCRLGVRLGDRIAEKVDAAAAPFEQRTVTVLPGVYDVEREADAL